MNLNRKLFPMGPKAMLIFSAVLAVLVALPEIDKHPVTPQVVIEAIHRDPGSRVHTCLLNVIHAIREANEVVPLPNLPATLPLDQSHTENIQFLLTNAYLPLLARSSIS